MPKVVKQWKPLACGNGAVGAAWHRVSLRTLPTETGRSARGNAPPNHGYDGIFDGYNDLGSYSEAFDEMFDAQGNVRGPYKGIFAELAPSDASELAARNDALGRAFIDQGITFSLSGRSARSRWTWCRG